MHHILAETYSYSGPWAYSGLIWWVVSIIGGWPMLVKAGRPGWGIIIPFYNVYLLIKVAGRPGWWLILFFIPIVNIVFHFIVSLGISENFGHGVGYAILLFFFAPIMYLVLGFGGDTWKNVRA